MITHANNCNTKQHMDSSITSKCNELVGSSNKKMDDDGDDNEEKIYMLALDLATASTLPMALKCAIELNLLELIKAANPYPASASQLIAHMPIENPVAAADQIDRILHFLAANSILNLDMETQPDGTLTRLYSLAPVCKYFTKDEDGVSLASTSLLIQDRVFMETWYHMKDAVLEGGIPFNRAYGMNAFEYPAKDPRFNMIFNRAMHESSTITMKKVLEIYKGFEGLRSLVDVGGGIGASLKMILANYPSIKAINFDLPHVIQHAPPQPGVEHVGGDMFVSVPKADAIFMKRICHDWSDAHCQNLLKNCYEALPEHGKVIIAENILSSEKMVKTKSETMAFQRAIQGDVLMLAYNPGGRERSEQEFEALGKNAGFKQFHKVCYAFGYWIMELIK